MDKVTRPHQIRRMLDLAEVYWIHLPEHTDMLSEGYIGITSETTKERYRAHIKESKRKDRKKYRIHNVIAKYKDSLIVDTLVICSDDYAIWLEEKLRPSPRIGWNTAAGGNKVKLLRDIKETTKHTEESKQKMSVVQAQCWIDNRESRMKFILNNLRRPMYQPKDSDGNNLRMWINRWGNIVQSKDQWSRAEEFYDFYKASEFCCAYDLTDHFGYDRKKKQWFQFLLRYFEGGWNPKEDPLWLLDFKGVENAA